ncbi:MAG: D-aminoacylase [Clostridia bacterium]|nr:D-aminoacylase [Clostridia bacterium]
MYELIIRGGTVADGTGAPAFRADIAIENGKIAAIGKLPEAEAATVVDAAGKLVTPGFIDIHRHADAAVFRPGFGEAELRQGLTTIVNGNCGLSTVPFGPAHRGEILHYLEPVVGKLGPEVPTGSFAEYFAACKDLPLHAGMLAGSGSIRTDVCGYGLLHPGEEHIRAIRKALETSLAEGALGVSLGLGYAPECFYTTEELISALAPLKNGNAPVTVHMRQEGDGVVESALEMLSVAKALNCPMHISHLKAMGKRNHRSKIPEVLRLLDAARAEGLRVDCDVYPYTAGSTQLTIILPPEFLEGGPDALTERLKSKTEREKLKERIENGTDFDNIAQLAGWDGIYLTSLSLPENLKYIGKNLAEIAEDLHTTPLDACCDLLVAEQCRITMIDFMAAEEDIISILRHPLSNLISDATYPTEGLPHPRVFGSFTRLIETYVLKEKALSVEEAVHKMTARPAEVLRLTGKGLLKPGMDADICVFRPEDLRENATYTDPCRPSSGMDKVLVGGKVALDKDTLTGVKNGTAIKG